jgi:hypothetical protein
MACRPNFVPLSSAAASFITSQILNLLAIARALWFTTRENKKV